LLVQANDVSGYGQVTVHTPLHVQGEDHSDQPYIVSASLDDVEPPRRRQMIALQMGQSVHHLSLFEEEALPMSNVGQLVLSEQEQKLQIDSEMNVNEMNVNEPAVEDTLQPAD
jgi:hypothetical protein